MNIQIVPIRKDFLQKVRVAGLDDQNQSVVRMKAQGGEPCRDVLRNAKAGEEIILASYCPFSQPGPYKEYGPIFVLAKEDNEEVQLDRLPVSQSDEQGYISNEFVLRAYNIKEQIVAAVITTVQNAERELYQILETKEVSFVLARYAAYGCYGARIERAIR